MIVYLSYALIILAWLYIFKTQSGLKLQGIGERPEAAFALMIIALLLVNSGWLDRLLIYLPPRIRRVVQDSLLGASPGGLGKVFVQK